MNQRPILFSAPMVRALLDGSKTQTRRICKPAADLSAVVGIQDPRDFGQRPLEIPTSGWFGDEEGDVQFACPYGRPGDQLWVRESWAEVARHEPLTDEDLPMRSDNRILVYAADPDWEGARQFLCADGVARWAKPARWTPSIHMPRWASRITLEIVSLRVERLQDISELDARAEGTPGGHGAIPDYPYNAMPSEHYRRLWDSLNAKSRPTLPANTSSKRYARVKHWLDTHADTSSWRANPWVWVVQFKVVKPC